MKNSDLLKVYAYAQTIFTNFTVPTNELQTQTTNLIWLKLLKPYSLEIIYSAIDQYAKDNNFINIVQIAELCKEVQEIASGTHQTAETYLKELEIAVEKSGTYESANMAYDSLSEFLKPLVPGYWSLGRWHNEGFEYVATRLKQEIKDKLRHQSITTSLESNSRLLENSTKKEFDKLEL